MSELALILLALVAAGPARAADGVCGSTSECLAVIERAQRETRTLQARFEQVKRVQLLEQPLVSRGRFAFKRPDRVRLEVTEPQPATLLIRGTEVRIPGVSEADAHAMAMTPTAAMFSRLGALFTGETRALEQDFEVSAHADGTAVEVALTPRQERWQKILRRIELRFSGPQLLTDKIRIDDSFGDELEITMLDVQRNVELPDTLFEP